MTTRTTAIALAAVCVLPLLLYAPFFNEPLQRDEGFYAAVGRMILHGGIPYRDAFDNKPPIVFGWYALSFSIFGEHAWAPRVVVSLLLSATTLLVYVQGRLLFTARAGLVAALAFALSLGLTRLGTNANTEFFLVLPLTAGQVAFTLGWQRGGWSWFFASGVLNGAAILTKETALFPFAYLMLFAWFVTADRRVAATNIAAMAGGGLFALAVAVLPFTATGTFDDLWDAGVVYTLKYVGDTPTGERIGTTLFTFLPLLVFVGPWLVLSFLAIANAHRAPEPPKHWLLIGWLLASYVGVVFVGRLYAHYFVQLLPAAGLLAPLGLRFVRDQVRQRTRLRRVYTTTLVLLAVLSVSLALSGYLRTSYDARHIAKAPNDALSDFEVDSPELAAYLREHTEDGDLIYNLGFQPELYFYSGRDSPTRFMFDRPFAVDEGYVDEAIRDLRAHPPEFIIDSAKYDPWYSDDRYDRTLFEELFEERYEALGKMYYADVYKLRD